MSNLTFTKAPDDSNEMDRTNNNACPSVKSNSALGLESTWVSASKILTTHYILTCHTHKHVPGE